MARQVHVHEKKDPAKGPESGTPDAPHAPRRVPPAPRRRSGWAKPVLGVALAGAAVAVAVVVLGALLMDVARAFARPLLWAVIDPASAAGLAAVLAFVAAIPVGVAALRKGDAQATRTRFFASLVLVGLAIVSANWFVTSLVVLVVATLITDTAYLQNLAAIAFNRSWWGVRAARRGEAEGVARHRARRHDPGSAAALAYSRDEVPIANALVRHVLVGAHELLRAMFIRRRDGEEHFVDLLAAVGSTGYVVELVPTERVDLDNALGKLRTRMAIYGTIREAEGDPPRVRGLLVVKGEALPTFLHDDDVAVLQYHEADDAFHAPERTRGWFVEGLAPVKNLKFEAPDSQA